MSKSDYITEEVEVKESSIPNLMKGDWIFDKEQMIEDEVDTELEETEKNQFLHDLVHDYIWTHCGVGDNGEVTILREEIDNPEKRSDLYEEFMEYANEEMEHKAMEEMECWQALGHIKQCEKCQLKLNKK